MLYRRNLQYQGDVVVIVVDVCSSADIVDQLATRGQLRLFGELLGALKHYIADSQPQLHVDPYKFVGDGWILFAPQALEGQQLVGLLRGLCAAFVGGFERTVKPHLDRQPTSLGLTFGLDLGPRHKLTIFGQPEYLGRPIIVASRLQGAIQQLRQDPANRALVSKAIYKAYLKDLDVVVAPHQVSLRNLGERPFDCYELAL